jgi:acyl-CoA thioester hydrolase
MAAPHEFRLRVYWEDTDAGGIVYYANYLKFIERARSELVGEAGLNQVTLLRDEGIIFAVRRCEIDYLASAILSDDLIVRTEIDKVGGASIDMTQSIYRAVYRGEEILVRAKVRVGAVNKAGRPARMPAAARAALSNFVGDKVE